MYSEIAVPLSVPTHPCPCCGDPVSGLSKVAVLPENPCAVDPFTPSSGTPLVARLASIIVNDDWDDEDDWGGEIPAVSDVMAEELSLLCGTLSALNHATLATFALDYTAVGHLGLVSNRAETLHALGTANSDWEPCKILPGMIGNMISDGVVSLAYLVDSARGRSCRTSLWRKLAERWQIVFHQETTVIRPHSE